MKRVRIHIERIANTSSNGFRLPHGITQLCGPQQLLSEREPFQEFCCTRSWKPKGNSAESSHLLKTNYTFWHFESTLKLFQVSTPFSSAMRAFSQCFFFYFLHWVKYYVINISRNFLPGIILHVSNTAEDVKTFIEWALCSFNSAFLKKIPKELTKLNRFVRVQPSLFLF